MDTTKYINRFTQFYPKFYTYLKFLCVSSMLWWENVNFTVLVEIFFFFDVENEKQK